MERMEGISVTLTDGEKEFPVISSEGYVGTLTCGKVQLEVVTPSHVAVAHVDTAKNIHPKSGREEGDRTRYTTSIRILSDQNRVPCTKYKMGNNVRLIEFEGNRFTVWEVALISQNGHFFLTTQKTYQVSCYQDRGEVSCPYFEEQEHQWPDLVRFVREVFGPYAHALPDVSEYHEEASPDITTLGEMEGKVLWWSFSQNFGLILTRKGVAIVHWSEAPVKERLAYLKKGEVVSFASLVQMSGSIKLQARGVSRLQT